MKPIQWNDRDVKFREISIGEGEAVLDAYSKGDTRHGLYLLILESARYADDGAPVFASLDEITAQPFRLQQRLIVMGQRASEANRIEDVELDEDGSPKP